MVKLIKYPTDEDWMGVKDRALVTVGKKSTKPPTTEWKQKILDARHSPIRYLQFSFYLEIPYWVSVHLVRHHEGCQPYVKSQRNDRQSKYDRNAARQDETVCMIWDMNAEALMTIMNKRLCMQAAAETRAVAEEMRREVLLVCPEFEPFLVQQCARDGKCHEMFPCGMFASEVKEESDDVQCIDCATVDHASNCSRGCKFYYQ